MQVIINGNERQLADLSSPCSMAALVEALGLKGDRIAIEHNREIVPRGSWPEASVRDGDRLEVVHFVGGGA